jgi:replicative DNA helicase
VTQAERKTDLRLVKPTKVDPNQVPPHDELREQALLSAILDNARVADLVVDLVTQADFYDTSRGIIFGAMLDIRAAGEIISIVSVATLLKDRGLLTQVGGPKAIADLKTTIPVLGQAVEHANKIAEKAQLRAFISDCESLRAEAHGDVGNVSEWLAKKSKHFRRYSDGAQPNNAVSLRIALESFFQNLNKMVSRRGAISGYTTGLKELDRHTAGWQVGEITLIGGETGLGKSAFAGGQALSVASAPQVEVIEFEGQQVEVNVPIGVIIFSLEMPKEQFAQRMICGMARVNYKLLQIGEGDAHDLRRLAGASDLLSDLPIFIDDEPDLSEARLEAKVARIEAMFAAIGVRLGLVLLDYFQLMLFVQEGEKSQQNREQLLANAARRLQQFASRFKARPKAFVKMADGSTVDARQLLDPSLVAFGVLTQLNNDGQVRESKAILQHAQNFWLLEATTETPEGPGKTTRAPIRIKKQRGGEREVVAYCWRHAAYTLYSDDER